VVSPTHKRNSSSIDAMDLPLLLKVITVALTGAIAGLGATWFAVERGHGFGAVEAGPWTAWPDASAPNADPYAVAALSRTGEAPLGAAEGLTFIARGDSSGALLSPACSYVLRSPMPTARYWTLTMLTPQGRPLPDAGERQGVTSREVVRSEDGRFEIAISRDPQPGNWAPVTTRQQFILLLRLYDTPLTASAGSITADVMPSIERGMCRR